MTFPKASLMLGTFTKVASPPEGFCSGVLDFGPHLQIGQSQTGSASLLGDSQEPDQLNHRLDVTQRIHQDRTRTEGRARRVCVCWELHPAPPCSSLSQEVFCTSADLRTKFVCPLPPLFTSRRRHRGSGRTASSSSSSSSSADTERRLSPADPSAR